MRAVGARGEGGSEHGRAIQRAMPTARVAGGGAAPPSAGTYTLAQRVRLLPRLEPISVGSTAGMAPFLVASGHEPEVWNTTAARIAQLHGKTGAVRPVAAGAALHPQRAFFTNRPAEA